MASKLEDRVPALASRESRRALATNVVADVAGPDGRVQQANLVGGLERRIEKLDVNEALLISEGRKAAATQVASAWANMVTVKIDRNQRMPVYQATIGFERSYIKVGSTFVPTEAVNTEDFETLLERQNRRIDGAEVERTAWRDLYDRARPGLEAGENLVQQFHSGKLDLFGRDGEAEAEAEAEEPTALTS